MMPTPITANLPDFGEPDVQPAILAEAGLSPGMRIGATGWKASTAQEPGTDADWLDLPGSIGRALRTIGPVANTTGILINPTDGLRIINDVDQLASFKFAASFAG